MSNSYLGSRVSLISKSLIRYEGVLYSIDAKESTIALSRVRFWGTENRPAEKYVPMRDEVYDYIIFRACDIRDLIVDPVQEVPDNETFEDPAIVQAHLFSTSGDNQQAAAPSSNAYSLGSAPNAHAPAKPFNGTNPPLNNVAENVGLFNGHQANPLNSGAPVAGSSFEAYSRGSSPPSQHQRSPLPEQQQNNEPKATGKSSEGNNANDKAQVQKSQQNGRAWQNNGNNHNNLNNQDRRPRHQNNNGNNYQFNHNQQNNRRQPGSFIQPHHGSNQFNRNNNHHHNNNNNGNMIGGMRRSQNGPMQQNGGPRPRNQQMGRPIGANMRQQFHDFKRTGQRKFDPALKTDFDFEKANQEFQELEHKLGKLNVTEPEPEKVEEEKTEVEESKSGDEECYDKKKSFFDKISCEALERSKGKINKVDWKHERKLNAETFGLQNSFRRPNGYNGYRNNYGNRHNGGNRYRNSSNNQNASARPVNA